MPKKQAKQAKQAEVKKKKSTDRAVTMEDLAELLVALDKKIIALENELETKNDVLARIRDRMGI